jgi:hypothetical protein
MGPTREKKTMHRVLVVENEAGCRFRHRRTLGA